MEHDSCVRGTSTSGHQEIVENFNIALKLRKYLQARGLTVLISKDYRQLRGKVEKIGDVGTNSLISFNGCGGTEERNRNAVCRFFNQDNACKAANSDELDFEAQAKAAKKLGASVIVAPHFDAAYGSRAVYYKVSAGESSRKLAESLADRMGEASIKSDQPIRGGKGSGLLAYAAKEGIPSVLVEFDPLNDAKFSDKNYADLLARHAAEGIANFLGSGKNAPTSLKSCSAADFSSPINQPQPRKKDADGAAFWYGSSDRKVSVDNQDGHHEGVDIAGIEHQTPVLAAGNGVIQDYSAAPPCGDGVPGTAVIIRHDCTLDGQPVFTKYCHLSRENIVSLKAGTRVAKGKLIGYVGKTGNANSERISTHLHV
ncbi:MAG TPA: peptidoglycan DD-metalloendopeptidase family protein, partial [Candidatus Norongarragalinales archaeon]|nr:peptidoglycan DD-metalloendopeptidase family protein [Candidatus Norongarragalinales archaeon]